MKFIKSFGTYVANSEIYPVLRKKFKASIQKKPSAYIKEAHVWCAIPWRELSYSELYATTDEFHKARLAWRLQYEDDSLLNVSGFEELAEVFGFKTPFDAAADF